MYLFSNQSRNIISLTLTLSHSSAISLTIQSEYICLDHTCHSAIELAVSVKEGEDNLPTLGCLNLEKEDHTKHGLLQIQALVPLLNFLNR